MDSGLGHVMDNLPPQLMVEHLVEPDSLLSSTWLQPPLCCDINIEEAALLLPLLRRRRRGSPSPPPFSSLPCSRCSPSKLSQQPLLTFGFVLSRTAATVTYQDGGEGG